VTNKCVLMVGSENVD